MSSRTPMSIQFPAYQIDFSAVAAGKRFAASKRRIRWRFGFPNLQALEAGRTGTDCRGEEHEVTIIWSVASGKRQIIMDGRELHFSNNRSGVIDFSWNTTGNHVFKTICHASPPLTPTPGFRQYDLFIDGQTFFRMPKLFKLVVKDNHMLGQYNNNNTSYDEVSPRSAYASGNYTPDTGYRGPRDPSEEDAELQRAIQASLEDAKGRLGEASSKSAAPAAPAPVPTADLLDFDGPPSSAISVPGIAEYQSLNSYDGGGLASMYNAPPTSHSYLALPPTQPPGASYGAPTPYQQPSPYGAPPPTTQYGAPPVQQQYPALPPSSSQPQYPGQQPQPLNQYAPQSNGGAVDNPFDILKQFGGPPALPAAPVTPTYLAIGYGGQPVPPPAPPQQQPGYYPPQTQQPGYYPPLTHQPGYYPQITHQPGYYAQTTHQPGYFPQITQQPGYYPPPPGPFEATNPYQQQHQPNGPPITNGTAAPASTTSLRMNNTFNFNETAEQVADDNPINPFDAVMKKLVNIDRIDKPADGLDVR